MEYANGGSLRDVCNIRRLLIEYIDCLKKYQYQIPLSLVYSWLETITDVLVYLHSKYCNHVSLYNQ